MNLQFQPENMLLKRNVINVKIANKNIVNIFLHKMNKCPIKRRKNQCKDKCTTILTSIL